VWRGDVAIGTPANFSQELTGRRSQHLARRHAACRSRPLIHRSRGNRRAADPLHNVTIIPRDRALGLMQQLPTEDKYSIRNDTSMRNASYATFDRNGCRALRNFSSE
jgi:hypothetical protein